TAGLGVNESDTARHVRQDLFVKDDFTLDASPGFHLALIKPAAKPREDRCQNDQPSGQHSHSSEKVMNWFVGDRFRLLYNCDPASRFNGTERIKIPVSLEMPALILADFIDQNSPLG